MKLTSSAWIVSAPYDTGFILAPALLVSLLAMGFSDQLIALHEIPVWAWVALIVGIDAGHVYSTLFRTYLVKGELQSRQTLLTLIPLLAWLVGCLLYSIDSLFFWRILAYLAVYHFVRQQYGFMMIYARKEQGVPAWYLTMDKAAIYFATLYPIVYWHCNARNFDWFIHADFLSLDITWLVSFVANLYALVLFGYVLKEILLWRMCKKINLPRNLLLLGTGLSWTVGIVVFNNDLIFTACNVLAHGIPYLALIWAYAHKQTYYQSAGASTYLWSWLSKLFSWQGVPVYLAFIVALAFMEEGLWDGLVWRERPQVFGFFHALPLISEQTQIWLVPLLALPQVTHYLLDAFIWRLKPVNGEWKQVLFNQTK